MTDKRAGSRRSRWFVLAGLAAVVSCAGTVGDDTESSGGDDTTGAGGTTSGGGKGGKVLPSPDTGLWRLTRTEYNNTVRDLLGDTTQPGNALLPDATFNGFDNNAEKLTTDLLAADKYDFVA